METKRKTWGNPELDVQQFLPQQYCDTCFEYDAWLTCAIPGSSTSAINDYNGSGGTYYPGPSHDYSQGNRYHSFCGNAGYARITGTVSSARGMETPSSSSDIPHPIYDIAIGARITATTTTGFSSGIGTFDGNFTTGYYRGSWKSNDENNYVYEHFGLVKVDRVQVRPGGPNAS